MNEAQFFFKPLIHQYAVRRPVDWRCEFNNSNPIDLEIGFGNGEFLARTAIQFPDRNFIGIEPGFRGVRRAIHKFLKKNGAIQQGNVRVIRMDARVALERFFVPQTLSKVCCLFSCPWPKKHHARHRLFSHEFLRLLNSRLVDAGEVLFVTDDAKYFAWVKGGIPGTGFSFSEATINPHFDTQYERKWCAQGQREFYELRLKKEKHIDVSVKEDCDMKTYYLDSCDPRRFCMENIVGDAAIVYKGMMYDPEQRKAIIHTIVTEGPLVQHCWADVVNRHDRWRLRLAEGVPIFPTDGVAQSLEAVYHALKQTA